MKLTATFALFYAQLSFAANIVLTNDDGWAVAMIRAQNDALKAAGHSVVLSCPAINRSGTGSSTGTPTPLTSPCEFNSCPAGSPAIGFNASDTRLNYVNAFPVDSVRHGIQTLSPTFFGGSPDFVVSGPNVGHNLGSTVLISGTVGAASEAALEGIPSIAISASSSEISQVSYTTLQSSPNSSATRNALIYANLTTTFVQTLLQSSARPILPANISININYATEDCSNANSFRWVLSRISSSSGNDVSLCGSTRLPTESSVIDTDGCFNSVSVFDARTKADVNATIQATVVSRISSLLTCLP